MRPQLRLKTRPTSNYINAPVRTAPDLLVLVPHSTGIIVIFTAIPLGFGTQIKHGSHNYHGP
jgi:hypothetical protein